MAFDAVGEDRDGQEQITELELAACEDRTGRDGELFPAPLARKEFSIFYFAGFTGAAGGANGLSTVLFEPDRLKLGIGLILGHSSYSR